LSDEPNYTIHRGRVLDVLLMIYGYLWRDPYGQLPGSARCYYATPTAGGGSSVQTIGMLTTAPPSRWRWKRPTCFTVRVSVSVPTLILTNVAIPD
jgi:hypothetical protein